MYLCTFCVCVFVHVCIWCMCTCNHACMLVCMNISMYQSVYSSVHACILSACIHANIVVCVCVCFVPARVHACKRVHAGIRKAISSAPDMLGCIFARRYVLHKHTHPYIQGTHTHAHLWWYILLFHPDSLLCHPEIETQNCRTSLFRSFLCRLPNKARLFLWGSCRALRCFEDVLGV